MTLDKCVKTLLIKEPFYGLFLLGVNRYFTKDIPTLGVRLNGINPELMINEEFWNSLDNDMQLAVLKHEICHILYKHIVYGPECYPCHEIANLAMDCEVNSNIPELQITPYVYPAIFNYENNMGTKWYYEHLSDFASKNESLKITLVDSHDNWGTNSNDNSGTNSHDKENSSKEFKQLVSAQIDGIAKNVVEQLKANGCGNIPGTFTDYIDSLFEKRKQIFNWKQYFRRMIGTIQDTELKKSRKKESIRFPDCSGIKYKRKANILVAIDTSGSVDNESLKEFFTEINYVYKAGTNIDIIEFDTRITNKWAYTGKPFAEIKGRGGTNFTPM